MDTEICWDNSFWTKVVNRSATDQHRWQQASWFKNQMQYRWFPWVWFTRRVFMVHSGACLWNLHCFVHKLYVWQQVMVRLWHLSLSGHKSPSLTISMTSVLYFSLNHDLKNENQIWSWIWRIVTPLSLTMPLAWQIIRPDFLKSFLSVFKKENILSPVKIQVVSAA